MNDAERALTDPEMSRVATTPEAKTQVVLATAPPYLSHPWLGAGLPLIATLLEHDGVHARIACLLENPYDVPSELQTWAQDLQWTHPSMEERFAWARAFAASESALFDQLVTTLLAGGEPIIGLSAWRTNVDVTLEIARRLREARPELVILLGGPEASESPADLRQDWVDAVVSGSAEAVVGAVVRAFLEGEPAEAAVWDNVWVHPRHGRPRSLVRRKATSPPIPRIDYTRIVPMLVDDPDPIVPVLLNLGCPYRCTFCVNTNVYPQLTFGENERLVDEVVEIMDTWARAFPEGAARPMRVLICDAAANAFPEQFDDLCQRLIDADMPLRPSKINAMVIMDRRFTRERARRMVEAGMDLFFGLESASPRVRKAMKKPGSLDAIREGCLACAAEGLPIAPGVIVGWPDETEDEFYETVAFLDWMVSLGNVMGIGVTPLRRSEKMMGVDVLADVEGPPSGLIWQGTGPGGSPKTRARRFLHVFEHFRHLVAVSSSAAPSTVIRTMLPDQPAGFWARWQAILSSDGDVNAGTHEAAPREQTRGEPHPAQGAKHEPTTKSLRPGAFLAHARDTLGPRLDSSDGKGFRLEAVKAVDDDDDAAVLQFLSPSGRFRVGLRITPRDDSRPVFLRTELYNLSYLERFGATEYVVDTTTIQHLASRLLRAERSLPRVARSRAGAPAE